MAEHPFYCRCGLAFTTVCLGVKTPVASWCSMVQRCDKRDVGFAFLRVTCNAGDERCVVRDA